MLNYSHNKKNRVNLSLTFQQSQISIFLTKVYAKPNKIFTFAHSLKKMTKFGCMHLTPGQKVQPGSPPQIRKQHSSMANLIDAVLPTLFDPFFN